jgi:hypothetical protein
MQHPPNDLFMSCTIGSPATPDAAIEFGTSVPMLAFHRGSLLATMVKGPLRVFKYTIALFPGRGIGAKSGSWQWRRGGFARFAPAASS